MNSDRTTSDLDAVYHGVIGLCTNATQQLALTSLDGLFELVKVFLHRRSKRVVRSIVMMFGIVVFEHRKIDHQKLLEDVRWDQILAFRNFHSKSTERGCNYRLSARDDQNRIA